MKWVGIDEAAHALGITPQSVRRAAREGRVKSRGSGQDREFLVGSGDKTTHNDFDSDDTGHDENDAWFLDGDEYVFRIRDDRFKVPAHQVQQWCAWYTYEGSGLTQREVCRKTYQEHGRDLTRDYLRRILKVLGIDKNSPPFAPHMLDKYDSEELAKLHFARAQARVETAIRAREQREWKKLAREEAQRRREVERKLETLETITETVAQNLKPDFITCREVSTKPQTRLMLSPHFTDLHVGKLSAQGYSSLKKQTDDILHRAYRLRSLAMPHKLGRVHVAFGGDLGHIDTAGKTTTAGTPQDMNTRPSEMVTALLSLLIELVQMWEDVAPEVYVSMVPGNHDEFTTHYMRAFLIHIFGPHPTVHVHLDAQPLQVFTWGDNLIALEHGDGPKDGDYGAILSTQYRHEWGATSQTFVQRGHLHHTHQRDINGVLVQGSRSPATADAWHQKKGYVTAMPGIDAYLYDKHSGKVGSFHA